MEIMIRAINLGNNFKPYVQVFHIDNVLLRHEVRHFMYCKWG